MATTSSSPTSIAGLVAEIPLTVTVPRSTASRARARLCARPRCSRMMSRRVLLIHTHRCHPSESRDPAHLLHQLIVGSRVEPEMTPVGRLELALVEPGLPLDQPLDLPLGRLRVLAIIDRA